jgi:hypothetical protein
MEYDDFARTHSVRARVCVCIDSVKYFCYGWLEWKTHFQLYFPHGGLRMRGTVPPLTQRRDVTLYVRYLTVVHVNKFIGRFIQCDQNFASKWLSGTVKVCGSVSSFRISQFFSPASSNVSSLKLTAWLAVLLRKTFLFAKMAFWCECPIHKRLVMLSKHELYQVKRYFCY